MTSRPMSPAEPARKHPPPIQPNAHPYAVKTTSTALLSRSNTTPHSAHHTKHHYVPSPPSRIPTGTRVRHRHSSSLSSVEVEVCNVNGVQTSPSITVASPDNLSVPLWRADEGTMPTSSGATEPVTENHSYDQKHKFSDIKAELYAGLPPNPKQWNTDELTTYLETSFKSGSNSDGNKADSSLVNILEYVRTRGFTGREILRLTDADLAGTPLSDVQRARLLERSRTLRAEVLLGRISADSYRSHEISDNSSDIYSQSTCTSIPLHTNRGVPASADDWRLLLDNNTSKGEYTFPPSPAMSLHRSNSVSDASAQRYRDLARMRMRRRGRVKGLVETWERASTSGSECSASEEGSVSGSEAGSESEVDREFESISDAKRSPESPSDLSSALYDVSLSTTDSALIPQELPLSTPPPPYTHIITSHGVAGDQEEEPSIEELLASSSNVPLRGARAWEADFGLGETVKRIPVSATDADSASPLVVDTSRRPQGGGQQTKDGSLRSKRSGMRRSIGSRGKNAKPQKRVVTAIFTGSPSEDASSDADGETHSGAHHRYASGMNGVVRSAAPVGSDLQCDPDSALRALEESISATRIQLEAFRLRLEKVEADTSRQEVMLMDAQFSDSRHPTELELRQRRSETKESATAEMAKPPRDEIFVEGTGNLEDWETMSLADIARAIVTRAMRWLFPYGHLGIHVPEDHDESQAGAGSRPGANDRCRSLAKRNGRLPVARMSCSIILVSFAICAAVLRRMGLGQWVRRP